MNLIDDSWIPVLRKKNRKKELIRPYEITDQIEVNPIAVLDAPRPDFNAALIQFLIGIVQTVMTPKDESEWVEHYLNPPLKNNLYEKMQSVAKNFNFDGDGPRFMQDMQMVSDNLNEIGNLLIESPGEKTKKDNTDHFIKRGKVNKMCPACTAMALFTLHTNAPSGGAGNRTSIRGGGPLTTIVIPDGSKPAYDTLWHRIWLNILIYKDLKDTGCNISLKNNENKFPWLAMIKTSEKKGSETIPDEIHPFQIFWSMPRRIRLESAILEKGTCDICGSDIDSYYNSYRSRPHGINYGAGILHPLSPYYSDKDGLKIPVHPQEGGFTYRHWPDYVTSNDPAKPRAIILQKIDHRLQDLDELGLDQKIRVYVFGYDIYNNMKVRCWHEAIMPYWLIPESMKENFSDFAQRLVEAAKQIASNTRIAVKTAWFDPKRTIHGDLSFVETEFWNATESSYYDYLFREKKLLEKIGDVENKLLENWLYHLNKESLLIFDFYAEQVSLDAGNIDGMPRVVKARDQLIGFNLGKKIREKLLNLPQRGKLANKK